MSSKPPKREVFDALKRSRKLAKKGLYKDALAALQQLPPTLNSHVACQTATLCNKVALSSANKPQYLAKAEKVLTQLLKAKPSLRVMRLLLLTFV